MTNELVVAQAPTALAPSQGGHGIFMLPPKQLIKAAVEIADVLKDVIVRQGLSTSIQGRDYVKVEGWTTLGTLLGVLPATRSTTRLADGGYEAVVELRTVSNGVVVGAGDALCGMDEGKWRSAPEYARRSMAITRATGKAYRLAFGWIMSLAGYQPTPAEEMDGLEKEVVTPVARGFDPGNQGHVTRVAQILEERQVPGDFWEAIMTQLRGRPFTDVQAVIERVVQ